MTIDPAARLQELASGFWISQAIHVAAELGLADRIERAGSSVEDLALASGTHAPSLHRMMRALAGVGIFAEKRPGVFVLTPMALLLRDNAPGNLRAFAQLQGADWHWQAWGSLLASVRSGKPAIAHARAEADCFELLAVDPDAARVFDAAMSGYVLQHSAPIAAALCLQEGERIVDVGGGSGGLLAVLLARSPGARGILFDTPQVIANAGAPLDDYGVRDRCELQAGDFFEALPAGGDVYLLCSVLHNWDDAAVLRILGEVVRAMPDGARVAVVESLIPPGNATHPGKLIDLEMLVLTTGRERTETEFAALFKASGLRLERVQAVGDSLSLLEGASLDRIG